MTDTFPVANIKQFVLDLGKRHSVVYVKANTDALANDITRLASSDVHLDDLECLLIALERAGVVQRKDVVRLHIDYLREMKI
jgi:hypothetical protein